MNLGNVEDKEKNYRVVRFEGGRGMRMKLFAMGLDEGDIIRVITGGKGFGPVMVENITKGTKIAIGRGMAERIIVEPVNE